MSDSYVDRIITATITRASEEISEAIRKEKELSSERVGKLLRPWIVSTLGTFMLTGGIPEAPKEIVDRYFPGQKNG